ncbi:MAG: hypothetical protein J0L69_07700 [Bacteroidetes bacterium]|nr:hypothetical protein [Bacteroidota bacterium]
MEKKSDEQSQKMFFHVVSFLLLMSAVITANGFGAGAVRFEKSPVCTLKPLYKDTNVFLFALNKLRSAVGGQKQSKKTTASARIAPLTRVSTS